MNLGGKFSTGLALVLITPFVGVGLLVGFGGDECAPSDSGGITAPPGSVKVMTWNLWGDAGDENGYKLRDRAPAMAAVINSAVPDVFLAQEAGWGKRGPWLRQYIQNATGLKAAGNKSLGNKARKIWYNTTRLKEVDSGSWTTPMGAFHKGATWARFTDRQTGAKFIVVDAHLEHRKPQDSLRKQQTRYLLDKLGGINKGDLPVIFAGDFNSSKNRASDEPAKILTAAGFVDTFKATSTTAINADFGSSLGAHLGSREVTRPKEAQIDHIFTDQNTAVHSWGLIPQASISDGKYVQITSDHNALISAITVPGGKAISSDGAAFSAETAPAAATTSTSATKWTSEQLQNANAIINEGKTLGVSPRGQAIALMTAIGESSLRVLDHGDTAGPDSRGLFQQRDGWGSLAERMNPTASAKAFYAALQKVHGWEQLSPTAAAHKVQRNAKADYYTPFFDQAVQLLSSITGQQVELGANATNAFHSLPSGCVNDTGDTQNVAWSSGGNCDFGVAVTNPRSCSQALAEAQKISTEQSCHNVVYGGTWKRRCLEFVARVYGYKSAGSYTAKAHHELLKSKGLIHDSANIPPGALVFFTSSDPAGHVAVYAGNGKVYSNDYVRSGCIDLTDMSTITRGGRYLGWAPPVFPAGGPLQ